MSKKILVVDDDQTNLKILDARLTKEGYEVTLAVNGEIGLGRAKETQPDLIVLDVEMPKMNGYTFLNELRKIEGMEETPVLILTAHENMEPLFKLKKTAGYVIKPVDFELLNAKITKAFKE